ncbi:MAG TPA: prepilin-type N-terminal cleavage/methylation domain-containing protein [Opitutaceae bacterium]|nr:prepilin-type N-terminal cleavage/methylation domain-containing protein [Opitutaceae bacterium]
MIKSRTFPFPPLRDQRGMTIIEVAVALSILGLVFAGVLGGLIQSRRLTEGSVAQSSAQAAVESYMEQMLSMPLASLTGSINGINTNTAPAPYQIPTMKDETNTDYLEISNNGSTTPTIPDLSTLTPGVTPTTPAGIIDNLKEIPANPNNPGTLSTWTVIWPNAQLATSNQTNATPRTNNLHMNIWVWLTDLSGTTPNAQTVYGITMIYTWQFWDGFGTQYFMGSLRNIRSNATTVPST